MSRLLALGVRERDSVRVPGRRFDLVQVDLVLLTAAALAVLFLSIERGLLGQPEMRIAGNASSAEAAAPGMALLQCQRAVAAAAPAR